MSVKNWTFCASACGPSTRLASGTESAACLALTLAFRRGHWPWRWSANLGATTTASPKRTLTVVTLAHGRARHDGAHDGWREMLMASDAQYRLTLQLGRVRIGGLSQPVARLSHRPQDGAAQSRV